MAISKAATFGRCRLVCTIICMGSLIFANVTSGAPSFSSPQVASRDRSHMEIRNEPFNPTSAASKLATGIWGGEHIRLEVTNQGATVEFDCAHGTIPRRIILDRRRRFDAGGQFVAEHGGPVRQDEPAGGYGVRFTGRVDGQRMKLTVRNSATKELLGDFILFYGREPRLRKCL